MPWNIDANNYELLELSNLKDKNLPIEYVKFLKRENLKSILSVPIVSQTKFIGLIEIGFRSLHKFTRDEKNISSTIASHLAFAISRQINSIELTNKKNELETLLETIPDLIHFKDTDGKYQIVNNAFENFVGLNRIDIIGKDASHIMSVKAFQSIGIKEEQGTNGNKSVKSEKMVINESGLEQYFETEKVPIYDSNKNIKGLFKYK